MSGRPHDASSLTPAELLEATGQFAPPIKLHPVLEHLGVRWAHHRGTSWARTDGSTLFVPEKVRARHAGVNLAIAHDLRQHLLGIPGRADDGAYTFLREQEEQFDRWARELVLPAPLFRRDALRGLPVATLAARYNVRPLDVIDRGQDLEVTHLLCRDAASYAVYREHPWWRARRKAYFATHRVCEHEPCTNLAMTLHHVSYARLGRELDEDLRALCAGHHGDWLHGRKRQLTLFDDVSGGAEA